MLVTRTQIAGVAEAVTTTFDGDHPCGLCTAIATGQEEEKRIGTDYPALKALEEIKLIATNRVVLPRASFSAEMNWVDFHDGSAVRADAPPTPPPLA